MRLFIAINFNEENKDILDDITRNLAGIALMGHQVLRDNHHLTMAFIGESDDVSALCACMDRARGSVFELVVSKLDRFSRNSGDILWLAIKPNQQLYSLQKSLVVELRKAGFKVENRPFKPHLTCLRDAVLPEYFDFRRYTIGMPEVRQTINKISLMKSERINGKLVYSEIYAKDLCFGGN